MAKYRLHLLIFILCCLLTSVAHAGWFDHNDQIYTQQISNLQSQVAQQAHTNSQLVVIIIILATGVVIALVTGAALGSKARNAAKEMTNQ